VRELLNYREAFNLVSDYLSSGDPITEGLIREIHKRLVEGVRGGAGNPGRYREIQNYVVNSRTREVIYTPPSPEQVPPLMRELVEWLRGETAIHPVLGAGIAQFQLVHIHPFVDGNGRTSRLLSTLCLYRAGASYRAIQSVREEEMDLASWLEYFVGGLATQLEEVKARDTAAIRADVIGRAYRLNGRQSALLTELFTAGRLALSDLEGLFPDVNRRTLQRDLKKLLEKGLLHEIGSGPTDPNRNYVPAEL